MTQRVYSRGTALPIVLLMSSMLLVTAAASFEMALVRARATAHSGDRVLAFHSADSALNRCARVAIESMSGQKTPSDPLAGEPVQWRLKASFEGASADSIVPFASWPHAARPPQCLIEAWPALVQGQAGAFLITARGFGRTMGSEVWLQQQINIVEGHVVQHWRRVVARPFQGTSP
ncbi:pilus assembly PilX family protein [Caballeronia sp.]|uniref:pilus assembly PilX family protein n=1 Tax=Caballeronia sp. TaxID=1931223 RepID=UPI003C38E190